MKGGGHWPPPLFVPVGTRKRTVIVAIAVIVVIVVIEVKLAQ